MSWYYVANGQQAGPVEDAELQNLVAAGAVTRETLVWRAGMSNWLPLASAAGTAAPGPPDQPSETCLNCGRRFPPDLVIQLASGKVCGECKPLILQRMREGHAPARGIRYGGFWIRLVARLIDGTITSLIGYVFQIPIYVVAGLSETSAASAETKIQLLLAVTALAVLLSLAASMFYEAWFLVHRGATPGKLILGLKVIRAHGGQMTWGLAIGRFFAQILSSLTLNIGFLMAAWDDEKRTLHDRICDTRVVSGN
jgi:uncharacterized RDD family membrane protein YckC